MIKLDTVHTPKSSATLSYGISWAFDVPASSKISNYMITEDQLDIESKVADDLGVCTVSNFITQEELSYLPQQVHQNLANIKYYSSLALTFKTKFPIPLFLGSCLQVKNFKGVVVGIETDYNDTVFTLVNKVQEP